MTRAYAGVTSLLFVVLLLSGYCWDYHNGPVTSNLALRDSCLTVWLITGGLLGVSQLTFMVMAVRRKQYVILALAGVILVCMAVYVILVAHLPS